VRKLGLIVSCLLLGLGMAGIMQGVGKAQTGKLVVIVEENESYGSIVGNSQAPYLNQLIASGELFTNYTGVADGSNPNYLAMTSGLTSEKSPPSRNIFQAIDGTGGALTWKEFEESAPGNCANGNSTNIPGTSVALYTADHDPAYYYRGNTTCNANDVPINASTFNPANLPSLSYIVPNECDDMHTLPGSGQACPAYFGSNTGSSLINMGDNWLAKVVPQLLAQPGVTVLITWDEDSSTTTPPEHVVAVAAGAGVTPGSTNGTAYNHYGLEAGLYSYFGLGAAPNNGATAAPLPLPGSGSSASPTPTTPSPTPTTLSPTPTTPSPTPTTPSPTPTTPSPTPTTPSPTPTTPSPTPTTPSPSPTPTPTGTCAGGITTDPSTPAVVHSGYGAGSLSTASFSPPAGSLMEVIVNALQAAAGGDTVTVTDSKGDTFTAGPHIAATKAPNSSWFFQYYETSAPGSLTVTAHQAGSHLGTLQLAVQVLDNAAPSQAGAAAGTYNGTTGTTSQTHALTNTQSGSSLYVVVGNGDSGATLTPVSGQVNVNVWNDPASGNDGAVGQLATSGTGSQLLGWTASDADPFGWAAQEVLHC
jgi:phosphatidylinositol-3-phosphatase